MSVIIYKLIGILNTLLVFKRVFLFFKRRFGRWTSVSKIKSFKKDGNSIYLDCENSKIIIQILKENLIRVRAIENEESFKNYSFAVIKKTWPENNIRLEDKSSYLKITTKSLSVRVKKSPLRIQFLNLNGEVINEDDPKMGINWQKDRIRCCKKLENENFYGLGEKTGSLNKKGHNFEMWNSDSFTPYSKKTDPLYISIPFFISLNKNYGIFLDSTQRQFIDFEKISKDYYFFETEGKELDYYFIYGNNPKSIITTYTELTGKPPLPPKWSLGFQQSRYSYFKEEMVRKIAQKFRKFKIPCDAIYLDIHYMDKFKIFTWDKKNFPSFKKMISDLTKLGFKLVTIIDPGIKKEKGYWVYEEGKKGNHFCKLPNDKDYKGRVWPGKCVFPDFLSKKTRKWWGNLYKEFINFGIRGFWNDMNEPSVFDRISRTFPNNIVHKNKKTFSHKEIHNAYGILMVKATYKGIKNITQKRPFVLTRSGYSGIQRYSAAWTGDNTSNWDHLKLSIPMCLSLGLSGVPFCGADTGGFYKNPTGKLFARWIQLGAFYPFFRVHTHRKTMYKEPWAFGKFYGKICKKFIKLRYKLLPYIYSEFYKTSKTGLPLMRPLFLEYPDDEKTYNLEDEFMFGPSILAAPIISKKNKRKIYLPEGEWYDFWNNKKITGPKEMEIKAEINSMPLFIRAGSIIPYQKAVQYTDEKPLNPLIFKIYPKEENFNYIYYEDDGESFNYKDGEFYKLKLECSKENDEIKFFIPEPEGNYKPEKRDIIVKLYSTGRPKKVILNGQETSWDYNEKKEKVLVKFKDDRKKKMLVISY